MSTVVRIRSWHIVANLIDRGSDRFLRTWCGRLVSGDAETRAELPGNERTCERCAVLALKADG